MSTGSGGIAVVLGGSGGRAVGYHSVAYPGGGNGTPPFVITLTEGQIAIMGYVMDLTGSPACGHENDPRGLFFTCLGTGPFLDQPPFAPLPVYHEWGLTDLTSGPRGMGWMTGNGAYEVWTAGGYWGNFGYGAIATVWVIVCDGVGLFNPPVG